MSLVKLLFNSIVWFFLKILTLVFVVAFEFDVIKLISSLRVLNTFLSELLELLNIILIIEWRLFLFVKRFGENLISSRIRVLRLIISLLAVGIVISSAIVIVSLFTPNVIASDVACEISFSELIFQYFANSVPLLSFKVGLT